MVAKKDKVFPTSRLAAHAGRQGKPSFFGRKDQKTIAPPPASRRAPVLPAPAPARQRRARRSRGDKSCFAWRIPVPDRTPGRLLQTAALPGFRRYQPLRCSRIEGCRYLGGCSLRSLNPPLFSCKKATLFLQESPSFPARKPVFSCKKASLSCKKEGLACYSPIINPRNIRPADNARYVLIRRIATPRRSCRGGAVHIRQNLRETCLERLSMGWRE